jgi:hypothetical protein
MLENENYFKLPPNTFFIHVHMINPYGASFGFKENENNVDLLKNINKHYEWNFENPIMEEFIDGLHIPNLNRERHRALAKEHFLFMIQKYGLEKFTISTKRGQKTRPNGFAYMGKTSTWSRDSLFRILKEHLWKNGSPRLEKRKIFFVNLHTAVGDFGKLYPVTIRDRNSTETRIIKKHFFQDVNDSDLASLEPLYQWIYEGCKNYSSPNAKIDFLPMIWEAGTFPQSEYEEFLLIQLHCRFYNKREDPLCQFAFKKVREFFYPESESYKKIFWDSFSKGMKQSINGFGNWIKE